jgi:hypothetical protein
MALHTQPESFQPLTAAGWRYLANRSRLYYLDVVLERAGRETHRQAYDMLMQSPAVTMQLTHDVPLDVYEDPRDRVVVTAHAFTEGAVLIRQWFVVMLVTCADAFLGDVLIEGARSSPMMMAGDRNEPGQSLSYTEIANAASQAAMLETMRSRWASNATRGGPRSWSKGIGNTRLRPPLDDGLVKVLEEAWGVRHVVVHRAGTTSTEFGDRHPDVGAAVGTQITVTDEAIARYALAIDELVSRFDTAIAGRVRAGQ